MAIGLGQLGPRGRANTPSETIAGIGDAHLLAVAVTEVERPEPGREILGHDDRVVVGHARDSRAEFVRMHRALAEVLAGCGLGLGPRFLGVRCQGLRARLGDLLATIRGGDRVDCFVEIPQALPRRARKYEVGRVVAADDVSVGREADELRCQRRLRSTRHDPAAKVGSADAQDQVRPGQHLVVLVEASQVLGMVGREVVISLSLVGDRHPELLSELEQLVAPAGLPDFVPGHQHGALRLDQGLGGTLDSVLRGTHSGFRRETLAR